MILLFLLISIGHCKRHWFLVDHARNNPYKVVYRVSNFAWQHKVPLHRRAFTYCEDELPAGLDLGKGKYGGPFKWGVLNHSMVFLRYYLL